MDLERAVTLLRENRQSVLITQRANGRPQSSNVIHVVGDDGLARVSITADRAKYANLCRTPLASLHVNRADFWAYVVVDADVSLSPVAEATEDDTVDALVDIYRAMAGEHADWDDYRRAMVADRRLVATLTPTHAYGMWPEG